MSSIVTTKSFVNPGSSVASPESNSSDSKQLNLQAIESWELYNQEGEAHQLSETKGWLGVAAGTLDWMIKKVSSDGNKTILHDQAEK